MLPLVALKEVTPGPAVERPQPGRSYEPAKNAKSFNINTYEICARKSFNINTYKNKGLKVL